MNNTTFPVKYLRWKQLQLLVPAHRVTIMKWVKEGRFPAPFQLNPGQINTPVAWKEAEILEWWSTRQRGFGPGTPSAWAARRRQNRNWRGPTPIYGLYRHAPFPWERTNGHAQS